MDKVNSLIRDIKQNSDAIRDQITSLDAVTESLTLANQELINSLRRMKAYDLYTQVYGPLLAEIMMFWDTLFGRLPMPTISFDLFSFWFLFLLHSLVIAVVIHVIWRAYHPKDKNSNEEIGGG